MLKKFLYVLFQIFWCFPQNLTGLLLWGFCRFQKEYSFVFRGAVVTSWNRTCCTSLGCFIFLDKTSFQHHKGILVHEYGHTIQSDLLGWLYLPVIFLPSVIWFSLPVCRNFRKQKQYSYYRFYTEQWANHLGEKICKEKSIH